MKPSLYKQQYKAMGDAMLALSKALISAQKGDPGEAVFIARRACRHLDKAVVAKRRLSRAVF
jgi:hypothetical protein